MCQHGQAPSHFLFVFEGSLICRYSSNVRYYHTKQVQLLDQASKAIQQRGIDKEKAEEASAKSEFVASCQAIVKEYGKAKRLSFCSSSDSGLPLDIWSIILCKLLPDVQPRFWWEEKQAIYDLCRATAVCKDTWLASDSAFEKLGSLFNDFDVDERVDSFLKNPEKFSLVELKSMSRDLRLKTSHPKIVLIANVLELHGICRPSKIPATILRSLNRKEYACWERRSRSARPTSSRGWRLEADACIDELRAEYEKLLHECD